MGRIIAVMNIKGGVGKTTITGNLAGVIEVSASPATGSLLISYLSKEEVAPPLGKALQTRLPRLDTGSLLAEMLA